MGDRFTLSGEANVLVADRKYADVFYGVSAAEASTSGYSAFAASPGLQGAPLKVTGTYLLNDAWFVSGSLGATQLLGSAADSPISRRDCYGNAELVVGVRF